MMRSLGFVYLESILSYVFSARAMSASMKMSGMLILWAFFVWKNECFGLTENRIGGRIRADIKRMPPAKRLAFLKTNYTR